jgi:hypothetical protein
MAVSERRLKVTNLIPVDSERQIMPSMLTLAVDGITADGRPFEVEIAIQRTVSLVMDLIC